MIRTLLSSALVALLATTAPLIAQSQTARAPRTAAKEASGQVVNLNTATAADLQKLPGIGARTAGRIIEYRQKNGPFKKIEELMNVRGVGEKNFLKLKDHIVVTPAKADQGTRQI